jgi:hypothetical protein
MLTYTRDQELPLENRVASKNNWLLWTDKVLFVGVKL